MQTPVYSTPNTVLVNEYFQLIRLLRSGNPASVEKLMQMWLTDGVFEFAGSPPVVGTYKGYVAIQTLYKNRLQANGMAIELEDAAANMRSASLGIVETEITHLREKEGQVIAGWRTTIGTKEGEGFDIAGSHLFTIEGGKIKSLRVNISPKHDKSQNAQLSASALTVQDVGRLSLAAWPVV